MPEIEGGIKRWSNKDQVTFEEWVFDLLKLWPKACLRDSDQITVAWADSDFNFPCLGTWNENDGQTIKCWIWLSAYA